MITVSRQDIIDTNRRIIEQWNEKHPDKQEKLCVRRDALDESYSIFENTGDNSVTRENLVKKAAYLMGSISWAQPFCGANKRTAMLVTATFLNKNEIKMEPYDEKHVRELLYDIQDERGRLNKDTMNKIILYILKSIK